MNNSKDESGATTISNLNNTKLKGCLDNMKNDSNTNEDTTFVNFEDGTNVYISNNLVYDYINQIKDFEVLNHEVVVELVRRIRLGDKEARDKLITHNIKLAITIAKSKARNMLEFEDLIQIAQEGLIHAIDKYDPEISSFSTYATFWILGYIKRNEENIGRCVRVPAYVVQAMTKVKKAKLELFKVLEREPNVDELMEYTGLDRNKVESAIRADFQMYSLSNELKDENGDGYSYISNEEDVEDVVVNDVTSNLIQNEVRDIIQNQLTIREQNIIVMHRYNNDNFDVIGKKLGISKQRVQIIERDAIKKIKKYSKLSGLDKLLS